MESNRTRINFLYRSRVRDVETGPDGFIYVAIEDPGRIIRLKPIKN